MRSLLKRTHDRRAWVQELRLDGQRVAAAFIEQRQRAEDTAVQQPIGNEVHGRYRWVDRAAQRNATDVLRSAPPAAFRNLQIFQTIQAPKSLVVHVGITLASFAFVRGIESFAARSWARLCQFRNPRNERRIFQGLEVGTFMGRTTPGAHDLAGFSLTQSPVLQGLHRFLPLRRPHPFFGSARPWRQP